MISKNLPEFSDIVSFIHPPILSSLLRYYMIFFHPKNP
jgi:hypothetical protein